MKNENTVGNFFYETSDLVFFDKYNDEEKTGSFNKILSKPRNNPICLFTCSSFHPIGQIFTKVYMEGGTEVKHDAQTGGHENAGSEVIGFVCY